MSVNEWIAVSGLLLTILVGLFKQTTSLNSTLGSLKDAINRLNEHMEDAKEDRQKLHSRADTADKRLDEHNVRLHKLEDWREGYYK